MMNKFYSLFAKYYDEIFILNDDTLRYLDTNLPSGNILDIGCATGTYALNLYNDNRKIFAFDLDNQMIEIAQSKNHENRVSFYQANMLDFKSAIKFDGVYCIGSTIAHLKDFKEIKKFILYVKDILVDQGIFIIQSLNYKRIYDQNIQSIDPIYSKDKSISLTRSYRILNEHLVFETLLKVKNDYMGGMTPLFPFDPDALIEFAQKNGFTVVKVNDGFNNKNFTKDSKMFTIILQKHKNA